MKLAMTLKVRDEAEIVADNIRFHAALGVSIFVVADHGSTDGTREILEGLADEGLSIHVLDVEATDVLELARTEMTRLARTTAELGADWMFHNDADEFWWPVGGDLHEVLDAVDDRYGLVLAPRAEFLPAGGEEEWHQRMLIRDARALRRPKIAHRAHPRARLHGVHPESLWVGSAAEAATTGPPKLRTDAGEREEPVELVMAPTFPIRVLHFPLRSFAQYERRLAIALSTDEVWGERAGPLLQAREEGRLAELYTGLIPGDAELEAALAAGRLLRDEAFAEFARSGWTARPEGDVPAELAQLEWDAMDAISRRMQAVARGRAKRKQRRADQPG